MLGSWQCRQYRQIGSNAPRTNKNSEVLTKLHIIVDFEHPTGASHQILSRDEEILYGLLMLIVVKGKRLDKGDVSSPIIYSLGVQDSSYMIVTFPTLL